MTKIKLNRIVDGNKKLRFDLTNAEHDRVQFLAAKHGFKSVAAYVRARVLEDR